MAETWASGVGLTNTMSAEANEEIVIPRMYESKKWALNAFEGRIVDEVEREWL